MTTEGTMAGTVAGTVHEKMTAVATDAATFATEIVTETAITTVDATMKKGIMTVHAINANTMTATVDVAHRADVPGVGSGTIDRGHPGIVRVSSPLSLHSFYGEHTLSVAQPISFFQLHEIAADIPQRHRVAAHHDGVHLIPARRQM
jgi:hypothetical protein